MLRAKYLRLRYLLISLHIGCGLEDVNLSYIDEDPLFVFEALINLTRLNCCSQK